MTTGGDYCDYDVVFLAVETRMENAGVEVAVPYDSPTSHTKGHEEPVFIGITELVEGPEGVIPSLMRVERSKERTDFRGDIFASPFSVCVKISDGIPKGEISALRLNHSSADRDGVSTLVQCRPESLNSLDSDVNATNRDFAIKFKNMQRGAIRICLDDLSSVVLFKESCDTLFESANLYLCAV